MSWSIEVLKTCWVLRHDEIVGHTNYELISKAPLIQMSKDLADQFAKLIAK